MSSCKETCWRAKGRVSWSKEMDKIHYIQFLDLNCKCACRKLISFVNYSLLRNGLSCSDIDFRANPWSLLSFDVHWIFSAQMIVAMLKKDVPISQIAPCQWGFHPDFHMYKLMINFSMIIVCRSVNAGVVVEQTYRRQTPIIVWYTHSVWCIGQSTFNWIFSDIFFLTPCCRQEF